MSLTIARVARERVMLARARTSPAIARLLAERRRLERRHRAALRLQITLLSARVHDAFKAGAASRPWTLADHALIMALIRSLGRRFGLELTKAARKAALDAASAGVAQYQRAFELQARAALGKAPTVPVDIERARVAATNVVRVRTDDVGARAGEEIGQLGVVESLRRVKRSDPILAAVVAVAVADAMVARAETLSERVLVTEVTGGYGAGGRAMGTLYSTRFPTMRRAWDATLDLRVCATCEALHHVVVDQDEPFPGGIDDEPAHPNCRCAVIPWMDDWTVLLDELGIGPGPHAGVQRDVERRLPSFGTLTQ